MSLFAASAASRHLRRHLASTFDAAAPSRPRIGVGAGVPPPVSRAPRALSSKVGGPARGSGLRRARVVGRRHATAPKSSSSSNPREATSADAPGATAAGGGTAPPPPPPPSRGTMDPHSIANEMVTSAAAGGRAPGTESVATLTREQRLSNYAMASGLLAFVSYVFYYSLASVGGGKNAKALLFGGDDAAKDGEEASNPGFEEFLREANEGRSAEERRLEAERQARGEAAELAELESSTAARLRAEGLGEDVVAAGANDEEEREMARTAGFEANVQSAEGAGEKKRRPLWKRVVFFWRRE